MIWMPSPRWLQSTVQSASFVPPTYDRVIGDSRARGCRPTCTKQRITFHHCLHPSSIYLHAYSDSSRPSCCISWRVRGQPFLAAVSCGVVISPDDTRFRSGSLPSSDPSCRSWTNSGRAEESPYYRCCSSHHRHLEDLRALLEHSFTIVFASILPQLLHSLELRISTAYIFCLPHCRHLKASYAAYWRRNDPNCYFPLAKLPTEITLMIASYLDPISRVCYKKTISSLLGPNRCTQRLFHAICIPTQPTCRSLHRRQRSHQLPASRVWFQSTLRPHLAPARQLPSLERWVQGQRGGVVKPSQARECEWEDRARLRAQGTGSCGGAAASSRGTCGSGRTERNSTDRDGGFGRRGSVAKFAERVRLRFRRRVVVLIDLLFDIAIVSLLRSFRAWVWWISARSGFWRWVAAW